MYLPHSRELKNMFDDTKLNNQPKSLPFQYGTLNHLEMVDIDKEQESEARVEQVVSVKGQILHI